MTLLAILAAMALSAADDPAVSVCEMLAKTSLNQPDSFVRTDAPVIDGRTVVIAFSERDRRGREKQDTRTCTFRFSSEDGRFHIEALRRFHLETRLAGAKARLSRTPPGNQARLVQSEILGIGRELFLQDERRKQAEHAARAAGIYPIATDSTRLK